MSDDTVETPVSRLDALIRRRVRRRAAIVTIVVLVLLALLGYIAWTVARLDHYATHRWADAPARMLGQLLTRTLEDTGGFRAVVHAGSGLQADLRLDTEIVLLRQSFLTPPSRAEFTLRAQLVDVAGRRVLATRYVEAVQEALSDDAPGGVAAANTTVARALAQVAPFCVEASAEARPGVRP